MRLFYYCFLFGISVLLGHLGGSQDLSWWHLLCDLLQGSFIFTFSKYFRDFLFLFSVWDFYTDGTSWRFPRPLLAALSMRPVYNVYDFYDLGKNFALFLFCKLILRKIGSGWFPRPLLVALSLRIVYIVL